MDDPEDNFASLDLYDDLITDEGLSRQENYDELSRKYDAAVLKIVELESKVDTLEKSESKLSEKCGILEKNISTLFLTARLELQRKDKEIQQYKHMREPRNQTRLAPTSNPRLTRTDSRSHREHSKTFSDPILVDKAKTKRRLSSDDREEKVKKKRKLSDKYGSYAGEKCHNVSRSDNGQNAARKILEKSRKDIQRRLSGGKSSTHAYDEHDEKTEREKKKRLEKSRKDVQRRLSGGKSSTHAYDEKAEREKKKRNKADKCSAYELSTAEKKLGKAEKKLSKTEKDDRQERKRKDTVDNEKRDETKTKDSRTKTTKENINFVEENKNKIAASRGVCDLREKLKMKRCQVEENTKGDNLLESKNTLNNISKVVPKSYSSEEKIKSLGDISSPKGNNRSPHTNRKRSRNRSSEDQPSPQLVLLAKSCDRKQSDHELKKKIDHLSPISKTRLHCEKQFNRNRMSSSDTISVLNSDGVVSQNELCSNKNLQSEKPQPDTHVTASLEPPLTEQDMNSIGKCSSLKVKDVSKSVSKNNDSSSSYNGKNNETCSASKKSKKETADNLNPSKVESTSSLPPQETAEKLPIENIFPVEAIQPKEKVKDTPTGRVKRNDQEKEQKLCLFSGGNVTSEEMSTVDNSEPLLGSSVVDRNYRKSRDTTLSTSSVLGECGTNNNPIKSVNVNMVETVESRETTPPLEPCTRAEHHSKEKLIKQEKHVQEACHHDIAQTKLAEVKKEPGKRQTDTTTNEDKINEKSHLVEGDIEHESRGPKRKLENSHKAESDEFKKIIKSDPGLKKLQTNPDQQTASCNFNVDDEIASQNCKSTEDIKISTKNVRPPLSPRNVKQTSGRSKGLVKIKTEHISSPAGKSKVKHEPKAMDVSVTKNEVIASSSGRKSREKLEPKTLDVSVTKNEVITSPSGRKSKEKLELKASKTSVTPSKHRHLSQVNQHDRQIPSESKSQIKVSPGSKENASVIVGFVCDWQENHSPVQLSKSERLVHKLNTDVAKKDLNDIQSQVISVEEVEHCDNLQLEKNKIKGKHDIETKMDSDDIFTPLDVQKEMVHEQPNSEKASEGHIRDITGSQRDSVRDVNTFTVLPDMSTGDYSTLEMDTGSCGKEKQETVLCGMEQVATEICGIKEIDTGSCGEEKQETLLRGMKQVATEICGIKEIDTGSCETEEFNTKTHEKRKSDSEICEKEKSESGLSRVGNSDTEKKNLDTELSRMEELDTGSCQIEKVDTKSHRMEELVTELNGKEKLNTGSCRIGKPDIETFELEKRDTVSPKRGKLDRELCGKGTRPCETEKLNAESTENGDSFEKEKQETRSSGKEKLDIDSSGIDKLGTSVIEMDEKETSSVIDEECGYKVHHSEEESKESLTKSSEQKLDLNDPGEGRLLPVDNLMNKVIEDDSTENRRRSASSAQSDSTLESDLEMSSDSESEKSCEEDRVSDSKTFDSSGVNTYASHHEDKLPNDLNNSVVSLTSESESDGDVYVQCSPDGNQIRDINDKDFGQNSPKQDGSKTPKQIDSGVLRQKEEQTGSEMHKPIGSQKLEQNDLQTPHKNQDSDEEDLDYEYESESSSLSSDQQRGSGSTVHNDKPFITNDKDLTGEFSELDTGAEDSQDDELMLCVSPSESMEFETEEDIEESNSENVKIKKTVSPKKKILCSRSKQEGARTSKESPGSLVSQQLTNNRKDRHKQRDRNPSHAYSSEKNGNRSNKKDRLDNSQGKSGSYSTKIGAKTDCRSRHIYTDEGRSRERERKSKMSEQKKHEERKRNNHDSPRMWKDHERKRLSKDHQNDGEKNSKDCHSYTGRTNKDRHGDHSDTERKYKDRHSDTERKYKDRLSDHSDTERKYKDHHCDIERISKDRHGDTERTSKNGHSDTERTSKDRHSDTERTYKDRHRDTERTSKDRHNDTERRNQYHSDVERISKDRHGDTERTFKDRHGDSERTCKDRHGDTERISKEREHKFKEQLSAHKRSSEDHLSEKNGTLKRKQGYPEGKTKENQNEEEVVSRADRKHHHSYGESSAKSSDHGKTSEKKAMRKAARNLEHKYENTKILRTVTSETIFSAEDSDKMTDTMELYDDEPKSAGVDNASLQGIGHINVSHNDLLGTENITIRHTDQCDQGDQGPISDDSKDRDRLHSIQTNKWSTKLRETSQHDIVNITHIDSDEEDMEIRVTDSSNSCSDDFLSDVSEPEKCARVRTWQEVAKIFRENVDILETEEDDHEESVVERSDNEDSCSESDSDTSGGEQDSDDSCYAVESNFTFELCKNPDTISDGEDVVSYASVEPQAETVCKKTIKSSDSCLRNPPEMYNENASDNFTDNLDDRFHNCPTDIPKNCFKNEESLEDGEILTDSEEKLETKPYGIKSRNLSSHVKEMLSQKNVSKSDKHVRPKNIGKSQRRQNRNDKHSSERPLISPRPSPRKGRSQRDEMYRRKHLQTAVKVLRNRSRERHSHTATSTSPVKVLRHGSSGNTDGASTDPRNRGKEKPSRGLENRLLLRKRKRSRSCERGSRIKHVSPRRS